MMETILVIGTITILSVSDENMIEPMHMMIQVKMVVMKESTAYPIACFRILYLTKTYSSPHKGRFSGYKQMLGV
jgi:hypothetical protein